MDYGKLIQDVIEERRVSPVDMMGIGHGEQEARYLEQLKYSYVRTLKDIDSFFGGDRNKSILETASHLGTVSIALKRLGYDVSATDIPEYQKSEKLRAVYEESGIPFVGVNLKNYQLPYESHSFDAVIFCEVLEHLNFNPLPIIQEFNRILKPGGCLYIGTPNLLRISNRLKFLLGKSIHPTIGDFVKQLDRNDNYFVGLHWREYTLNETVQMLEEMGFKNYKGYYFTEPEYIKRANPIKKVFQNLACMVPVLRHTQVVMGQKVSEPVHDFWYTDANSIADAT